MTEDTIKAELNELRIRADALEVRQAAIEARQGRIERMLLSHEGEHKDTKKLLVSLNERMDKLIETVLALANSRTA